MVKPSPKLLAVLQQLQRDAISFNIPMTTRVPLTPAEKDAWNDLLRGINLAAQIAQTEQT